MRDGTTIFAISSGAPPAAIAILRISGADAFAAGKAVAGSLPRERHASLRRLHDPNTGDLLDSAVVLVFAGPATATGEDLVELHLHGGRAVVAAVERALASIPGLRPAEPGEFTRRALTSGRIDLTEAEGLGDLLLAETEAQRRAAISAVDGGIRRRVETWSQQLLHLSARVEAELDFSDEDDVSPLQLAQIIADLVHIADDLGSTLQAPPVERLRDGVSVVLSGPPNSGKSTLLNAMVDQDVAIVSPIAGTTRDRIDVPISRNGIAYRLTDTAGLAVTTNDPIEAIGIERARRAMDTADILVWLGDDPAPHGALWVHSRSDADGRALPPAGAQLGISAKTGQGMWRFWGELEQRARTMLPRVGELAFNRRQRSLLSECHAFCLEASSSTDALIVADGLRMALISLDRITGHSDTEAMLDTLFRNFCIGK